MKVKNCPLRKSKSCFDYGNCEGCSIGKKITYYESTIKRLKQQNQKKKAAKSKEFVCILLNDGERSVPIYIEKENLGDFEIICKDIIFLQDEEDGDGDSRTEKP